MDKDEPIVTALTIVSTFFNLCSSMVKLGGMIRYPASPEICWWSRMLPGFQRENADIEPPIVAAKIKEVGIELKVM